MSSPVVVAEPSFLEYAWQTLLSLAAIGALGVIVRLILRPRLYLTMVGIRCRDDGVYVPDPWGDGAPVLGLYLRLQIENRGLLATAAKDCGVFVDRIAFNGVDIESESSPLMWTDRDTYDRQILDARTHTYVDLCFFVSSKAEYMFIASQKGRKSGVYGPGLYRFDVVARAGLSWPERHSFFVDHCGWTSRFLPQSDVDPASRRVGTNAALPSSVTSWHGGTRIMRDRLHLLADEILQFIAHRNSIPIGVSEPDKPLRDLNDYRERSSAAFRESEAETRALYARTFADRVIEARDEIRRAMPDENLGIYEHPYDTSNMAAVAEWLRKVADRLP